MLLRMFLAFPLTFLLVNAVTIVVGVIGRFGAWSTLGLVILGLVALLVVILLIAFASRRSDSSTTTIIR